MLPVHLVISPLLVNSSFKCCCERDKARPFIFIQTTEKWTCLKLIALIVTPQHLSTGVSIIVLIYHVLYVWSVVMTMNCLNLKLITGLYLMMNSLPPPLYDTHYDALYYNEDEKEFYYCQMESKDIQFQIFYLKKNC